ncbi:hypothetical protein BH11ACT2_BH11ACT2_03160 [soil metagenome]
MTTDAATAKRISRRWPLVSSGAALVLVAGLAFLVSVRGTTNDLDTDWMEEVLEHRSPLWTAPSLVMNFIGAGWFAFALPAAIALIFVLRRRLWTALYVVLSSAVSAGVVQLLKVIVGRHRPDFELVQIDSGSFPSGHSANAATLAVVVFVIFPKVWVFVVGLLYTLAMMVSRTYLGVHWLTDTIGGLLLGAAVAIMIWAPFAYRLQRERHRKTQ